MLTANEGSGGTSTTAVFDLNSTLSRGMASTILKAPKMIPRMEYPKNNISCDLKCGA
jgi:hypothetical protein